MFRVTKFRLAWKFGFKYKLSDDERCSLVQWLVQRINEDKTLLKKMRSGVRYYYDYFNFRV